MSDYLNVNRPAMLKNVSAFTVLLQTLVERRLDLPGLACFYGKSGVGKTKSAIFGANRYSAIYVECGQFTNAKSLLVSILKEFGVANPKGSIPQMIEDAVEIMAANVTRPLIVDEAHHIAHKKFVDLLRELHDKSYAPVVLIGEETLPKKLEAYERVHNRMLEWVEAVPCDADDVRLLAANACEGVTLTDRLIHALIEKTAGNTRRIVVNLAQVEQVSLETGKMTIDLDDIQGRLVGTSAVRRVA